MIFNPIVVPCMWDTWLYFHEGKHYLFYLHNSRVDARWDGFSMAVSDDGVHYVDLGPILSKTDDAMWLGTGMTWKVGDTYLLNFSENRRDHQEIAFAQSKDLLHWERLPYDEYVSCSDPHWYAPDATLSWPHRWDGIWVIPRDDQPGWVGYVTAVANGSPPGLGGTAACVISDDGTHFRAAPPVIEPGRWGNTVELGAVEKIGSRYYMLLNVHHNQPLGARHFSSLLAGEVGTYVLTADSAFGPFDLQPNQPPIFNSSPIPYSVFPRFYRCGDELLINHHTMPRTFGKIDYNGGVDVRFSPLKTAHVDENGVLTPRWWKGNEALKGAPQLVATEYCTLHGLLPEDCRPLEDGLQLTAVGGGLAVLPTHHDMVRGVVLEADLTLERVNGALAGVGVFIESGRENIGTVIMAQSNGQLTVGGYNSRSFRPEDAKQFTTVPAQPQRWRVLVRDVFVEVYVDDVLVQCYTLNHTAGGRLGFVVEAAAASISNLHLWAMSF